MGDRAHRWEVGTKFSEGARLLWLALEASGQTREELRKALKATAGGVSRWLYGDRKPSRATTEQLFTRFGIPVHAWSLAPTEPFTTPAACAHLTRLGDRPRAGIAKAIESASASIVANDAEDRPAKAVGAGELEGARERERNAS